MLICVRTTIVLDDRLFREAKRRAASRGVNLSQLLDEALRAWLAEPDTPAPKFEVITYGEAAGRTHHEPADFARALEDEDRSSVGDDSC